MARFYSDDIFSKGFIDLDASSPIHRSYTREKDCSLFIIELVDDYVIFNEKVPITLTFNNEVEIDTGEGGPFGYTRLKAEYYGPKATKLEGRKVRQPAQEEWKVKREKKGQPGDVLVSTVFPWSNRRVAHAVFKGARQTGDNQFLASLQNDLSKKLKSLSVDNTNIDLVESLTYKKILERLEEISFDPWQRDKSILTASSYGALRHQVGSIRSYQSQNPGGKKASDIKYCRLSCIVRNFNEVRLALTNSPTLNRLLEQSGEGKLRITDMRNESRKGDYRFAAIEFKDVAEEYMDLSIELALGGPYDDETWIEKNGNRVEALVKHIFLRFAQDFTRHVSKGRVQSNEQENYVDFLLDIIDEEIDGFYNEVERANFAEKLLNREFISTLDKNNQKESVDKCVERYYAIRHELRKEEE